MRRRLRITADDRLIRIEGPGARDLVRGAGVRVLYIHGRATADRKRLGDLLAYLDRRHVDVEVIDHAPPPPVAPATPEPAPVGEVAGLW